MKVKESKHDPFGGAIRPGCGPDSFYSSMRSFEVKIALFRSVSCWMEMATSLNVFLSPSLGAALRKMVSLAPSPSLAILLQSP